MIIALIGFCILISMIIIIDLFFVILVTYKTHTHISKFMLKGDLKYTVCGLRHYGIWKYNSGALNVRLINNKPIFKLYLSPFIGWYLFFNKAVDEDWCIIYHEVGHYLLDQMVINTPHSKWHTKKKIWHILNKAFIESYS